jgi:hypothetical protein
MNDDTKHHCPCRDRWTPFDGDTRLAWKVALRLADFIELHRPTGLEAADFSRLEELSWWLDKALHGFPACYAARATEKAAERERCARVCEEVAAARVYEAFDQWFRDAHQQLSTMCKDPVAELYFPLEMAWCCALHAAASKIRE